MKIKFSFFQRNILIIDKMAIYYWSGAVLRSTYPQPPQKGDIALDASKGDIQIYDGKNWEVLAMICQ